MTDFAHLHATQTAQIYRPAATDDEGVEIPDALDTPAFALVVALAAPKDTVKRSDYGADVTELWKVKSLDRSNLMRPKDVIAVTLPDGRAVRLEVAEVNSALAQTQQAMAIRRAS
ncbi:MAG: hypothetical protein A2Y78_12885 [Acidobacteria bacterium RBG_13_68_16]|nr:MAG: hypothetical protein A2Y78_12885 [Acidobacteria bacterium RBG_13_68_16]